MADVITSQPQSVAVAAAQRGHPDGEGEEERPDRLDRVLADFRRPCGGGSNCHRFRLACDDIRHLLSSLSIKRFTQRLRVCRFVVIAASGHPSPRLAELTGFQLAGNHADDRLLCIYKDACDHYRAGARNNEIVNTCAG